MKKEGRFEVQKGVGIDDGQDQYSRLLYVLQVYEILFTVSYRHDSHSRPHFNNLTFIYLFIYNRHSSILNSTRSNQSNLTILKTVFTS